MNGIRMLVAALAALALPGVAMAGAGTVPRQFCQAQFVPDGPLYDGVGITVGTPSGSTLRVCRVTVPPPPETVVTTFPDGQGDIVVVTRSGAAILVFH